MPEIEGEQSRRRNTRQRRLLLALAGLVVLAGAVVGGVVLDRTVLDDDDSEISDAEHDRLIRQCEVGVRERDAESRCTNYIGGLVEWAETHEGVTYRDLSNEVDAAYEDALRCDGASDNASDLDAVWEDCMERRFERRHPNGFDP